MYQCIGNLINISTSVCAGTVQLQINGVVTNLLISTMLNLDICMMIMLVMRM